MLNDPNEGLITELDATTGRVIFSGPFLTGFTADELEQLRKVGQAAFDAAVEAYFAAQDGTAEEGEQS